MSLQGRVHLPFSLVWKSRDQCSKKEPTILTADKKEKKTEQESSARLEKPGITLIVG